MEIVIILLLIAAVAFVVYFQLKGSRPDVIPVQHLGSGKKAAKKAVAPKKEVVEQWDALEVSKKKKKTKKDDDESPKKKKKERYDPVAQGKKVLKSETLKKRETAGKADDEKTADELKAEKQARNRLAADGFVVIDEKKAKKKVVKGDDEVAAVEKVVEEAPLSEFEERLKRLRDVVSGMKPAPRENNGEGYKGPRKENDAAPEAEESAAVEKKDDKKKNEEILKQLQALKEQTTKATGHKAAVTGGRIKTNAPTTTISAPTSGKRGWEKVVKKAAPAPVEEEAAAEEPAVEEAAAPAVAEDEWAEPVEVEEF